MIGSLLRQERNVAPALRVRWTEADVDALPDGEHDYFERKSGRLFADQAAFLGKLAKTVSALANSGGGHLVLGVADDGTPDGIPPLVGRTSVKDWLEQKLPNLVSYPLSLFRVHLVERGMPSRVPPDREVVVIDVGDSPLAPHQCVHNGGDARKNTYYYRQAGRSEPAPHFYLELLRQRLVGPSLVVDGVTVAPKRPGLVERGHIFLPMTVTFGIENTGRVAAYDWGVRWLDMSGYPIGREGDYKVNKQDFPDGFRDNYTVRSVGAILPGMRFNEAKDLGVVLRPASVSRDDIEIELTLAVRPIVIAYRLATETSPGERAEVRLGDLMDIQDTATLVANTLAT
jgi:hypothetical protein